jgi:hypothetical protein
MSFTDRFIKVPIHAYSRREEELTGNAKDFDSWLKLLPFELSNYKPSYDEQEPDIEITHIMLKNGEGCLVYLSPEAFEKLLNDHNSQ